MPLADSLRARWKWLAAAVAAVVLVVVVAPFVYINFIKEDAPERLSLSSGSTTSTTAGDDGTTTTTAADDSGGATDETLDGRWTVGAGSVVGYRVEEVLFGQNTEAAGRTEGVTGEIVIAGTTVESGGFEADLTQVKSDEERRDGQFQERIMDTATYPTATFELTAPLELTSIPDDLVQVTTSATGDLTVRDTTRSVTFDVVAQRNGDTIEINGSIPVVFADYGIANPSTGGITTEDNGLVEFVLVFEPAA